MLSSATGAAIKAGRGYHGMQVSEFVRAGTLAESEGPSPCARPPPPHSPDIRAMYLPAADRLSFFASRCSSNQVCRANERTPKMEPETTRPFGQYFVTGDSLSSCR